WTVRVSLGFSDWCPLDRSAVAQDATLVHTDHAPQSRGEGKLIRVTDVRRTVLRARSKGGHTGSRPGASGGAISTRPASQLRPDWRTSSVAPCLAHVPVRQPACAARNRNRPPQAFPYPTLVRVDNCLD